MGAFLIAMVIGVIPAMIAQKKGRSFIAWYIYGVLLFIIALPHSLIMKSKYQCPHCRANIDPEATVCQKCTRDISKTTENGGEVQEITRDSTKDITEN